MIKTKVHNNKLLTQRQAKVFRYIRGYIKKNEKPPTKEELNQHFIFKDPRFVLKSLEKKGYISTTPEITIKIQRVPNIYSKGRAK